MRALLLVAIAACGAGTANAPAAIGPATDACVRDFIAGTRLPDKGLIDVKRVPRASGDADPHYYVFVVHYGAPQDCESGCFSSQAVGVATACDRIGWIGVQDYDQIDKSKLPRFTARADDAILYDDSHWREIDWIPAFTRWLARSPDVPADVRAKAKATARE